MTDYMVYRWTLITIVALLIAGTAGVAIATGSPEARSPIDPNRLCPQDGSDAFYIDRLKDKRIARARAIAEDHGCVVRITRRNGEDLVVTADLRDDRVNVAVRDRRVTRVFGVG